MTDRRRLQVALFTIVLALGLAFVIPPLSVAIVVCLLGALVFWDIKDTTAGKGHDQGE